MTDVRYNPALDCSLTRDWWDGFPQDACGSCGCLPGEHAEPAPLECINGPEGCRGVTVLRMSLSGTGTPYPRCDGHWDTRLDLEDDLRRRYPDVAPSDWSPYDAGEEW